MTTPSSKGRLYARFIPSEEVGDVTQWQFGSVDGSDAKAEVPEEVVPVEVELNEAARQELLEQAGEEAFARGQEQGAAQAALQWQQRMDDYIAEMQTHSPYRHDRVASGPGPASATGTLD